MALKSLSIRVLRRYTIKDVRPSCTLSGDNVTYLRRKSLMKTKRLLMQCKPSPSNLFIQREVTTVDLSDIKEVTLPIMKRFLNSRGISFKEGHTCLKMTCPFCKNWHGTDATLYINAFTGMFICYACKCTGSWPTFEDYIEGLRRNKNQITKLPETDTSIFLTKQQLESVQKHFEGFRPISVHLNSNELQRFKLKHLQGEILQKFNVRMTENGGTLAFPLHDPCGNLVGVQSLSVDISNDGSEHVLESFFPRNPDLGVFGMSSDVSEEEIVLTANPLDAMAVTQQTNKQAVSLPRGISGLPIEILPMFEKFSKITLWFGNTMKDFEAERMFFKKLGHSRCHIIRLKEDPSAPLSSLEKGLNLTKILNESRPITHKDVTTFKEVREDILTRFSRRDELCGVKWQRFPGLNCILKGHRRGELTIFTGPTGAGKTTFISEYSIDLCSQGVRTLWGSFEIPFKELLMTMLRQFSVFPLDKYPEQFDSWADKFEQIPLYFLTFYGQQSSERVFSAMEHACYVHDVQHIVVDNVQFMMGIEGSSRWNLDRFTRQDLVISKFRSFATKHNCHLTLIMHPRKERDELLTNSSVFGGAKATQEADNVFILQDKRLSAFSSRKYIQITKNRFDGQLGVIPLKFDKETLSFSIKKSKKGSQEVSEQRNQRQVLENKTVIDDEYD